MLIATLIAVVALLLVAMLMARQPSTFRVARSATIAAPAPDVFPYVNDLRQASAWSPWLKPDPNVRQSFEGPPADVGASSTWAGNHQVGEGRQTIIESQPAQLVRLRLDFKRPFESTCIAEFTLQPERGETRVIWSLTGENTFVSRAISLFLNQDKMIGGQFEQGLADLKSLAESALRK